MPRILVIVPVVGAKGGAVGIASRAGRESLRRVNYEAVDEPLPVEVRGCCQLERIESSKAVRETVSSMPAIHQV